MAFIVLRRSRNTKSYYLVESYRDRRGKTQKRTLCYLGREQDGTDTIEKAIRHWERIRDDRWSYSLADAAAKVTFLKRHLESSARMAFERKRRARAAEEAPHWQAITLCRRAPTEENARAAKRAFRALAVLYHPDQGGEHHAFIQLKRTYEQAIERWEYASRRS